MDVSCATRVWIWCLLNRAGDERYAGLERLECWKIEIDSKKQYQDQGMDGRDLQMSLGGTSTREGNFVDDSVSEKSCQDLFGVFVDRGKVEVKAKQGMCEVDGRKRTFQAESRDNARSSLCR